MSLFGFEFQRVVGSGKWQSSCFRKHKATWLKHNMAFSCSMNQSFTPYLMLISRKAKFQRNFIRSCFRSGSFQSNIDSQFTCKNAAPLNICPFRAEKDLFKFNSPETLWDQFVMLWVRSKTFLLKHTNNLSIWKSWSFPLHKSLSTNHFGFGPQLVGGQLQIF